MPHSTHTSALVVRLLAVSLLAEAVAASDPPALAALPPLQVFQPANAVAGDVDGDGHVDLIVQQSFQPLLSEVALLRGRGDGSFEPPQTVADLGSSAVAVLAVELHDVNADGQLDLLALPADVRLGDGSGGFGPPIPMGWQQLLEPFPLHTTGDVDGDGLVDVVLFGYALGEPFSQGGTPRLLTLLSDGAGGLQPAPGDALIDSDVGYPNLLVDVDHDGHLDVVANAFGSNTSLLAHHGQGGGLFLPGTPVGLLPDQASTARAAADMDADGWTDIVTASYDNVSGAVSLWVGLGGPTGDFSLQPGLELPAGTPIRGRLVLADVTGDGRLDAVSVATFEPDGLLLASGDGAGGLAHVGTFVDDWHRSLVAADIDADGQVELIAANANSLFGDVFVVHGAPDSFVDVGLGTGLVTLSGSGSTTPEALVTLQLSGTPASLAAWMVSLDALLVELPVGTLVPDPLGALGALLVAPANAPLRLRWPQGLPAGTQVYAQALALGELSNALIMVARSP